MIAEGEKIAERAQKETFPRPPLPDRPPAPAPVIMLGPGPGDLPRPGPAAAPAADPARRPSLLTSAPGNKARRPDTHTRP